MGEHICFRRNERLATVNPYWRGNPMVRGRFFNRQHRFRPGMGSVLKWRLSPNPQRKEKKTVKWDPKVCYLRSLDAVVGDSLIWLGNRRTDKELVSGNESDRGRLVSATGR